MKNYVIAAALKSEFPFENDFPVLYTGVGKTNSTLSLSNYLNKNKKTDLVINVGSAGAIKYKKGAIIECGIFIDGQLNYPNYIEEHIVFQQSKSLCLTFDNFIIESHKQQPHCVDMESFSLAKTCQLMGVNFLCFKYISDIIGENNQEQEWLEKHHNGKDLLKNKIQNII